TRLRRGGAPGSRHPAELQAGRQCGVQGAGDSCQAAGDRLPDGGQGCGAGRQVGRHQGVLRRHGRAGCRAGHHGHAGDHQAALWRRPEADDTHNGALRIIIRMLWRNKNLPRRCILCDWGLKGGLTDTYRISYTFNGKVSTFPLSAESAEKADKEFKHLYPRIKTVFKIERVYTYKTVQEELQFTLTDDVKKFLLALLNSEKTHFYLEGNNAVSKEIEDKYCELTKEVLVPKRGLYNIAPDAKWGVEANIFFDSS